MDQAGLLIFGQREALHFFVFGAKLLADVDRPGVEIDVDPAQAADLAQAQAGQDHELQLVRAAGGPGRLEEGRELLPVHNMKLLLRRAREADVRSGIIVD